MDFYHLFIIPLLFIFAFLLFLVFKDKVFQGNKKLIRIHKYNKKNYKPTILNSQNSGIIFVSKIIKPTGIKDSKNYEIPRRSNLGLVNQIKYNGLFDVKVSINQNLKSSIIIVKGDKSFVDLIDVNIVNNIIEIKHPQISCSYDMDCEIIIKTRELVSFSNKGRGQVDIEGINSETFTYNSLSIENSYLSGNVKTLHLSSRSKGDIFSQQLNTEIATVESSGIGNVYCNAKDNITVRINNSGNVFVKDFTVRMKKHIEGKGKVIYRPFEDSILNFIFISFQKILFKKIN